MTNEAFSLVMIDVRRKDWEWGVGNGNSVRFDCMLPDEVRERRCNGAYFEAVRSAVVAN